MDIKRHLTEPLLDLNGYKALLQVLEGPSSHVRISGATDSQRTHLAYSLCCHTGRKGIFVAPDMLQARFAYQDLLFLAGEGTVLFPPREVMLHDIEARSHNSVYDRIGALDRIVRGDFEFIVTSADALAFKLMSPSDFIGLRLDLSAGQTADPDDLHRRLALMGYERVDFVEGKGQFAARGGILDIFAVNGEDPFRIEFFGNEIDSIRTFDVLSQRSMDKADALKVLPASDLVYSHEKGRMIAAAIMEQAVEEAGGIRRDAEYFADGRYFPGIDRYVPFILDKPSIMFDYLPDSEPVVYIGDPESMERHLDNMADEHFRICEMLAESGRMPIGGADMYFGHIAITGSSEDNGLHIAEMTGLAPDPDAVPRGFNMAVAAKSNISWHGAGDRFRADLKEWKKSGKRVLILSDTHARASALTDTLASEGIEAVYAGDPLIPPAKGQIVVTPGSLRTGFEYSDPGFVVVSLSDIRGGRTGKTRLAGKRHKGLAISSLTDLTPNDYVVHQLHGIGQYLGMQQLVVDNVRKDYIKVRYLNGDFLYIPSTQLVSIQKYIGSEGKGPRLNRLGSSDWGKTKRKVTESLRKLAVELIRLYAQRQELKGFAFSKDTVWQTQFEEGFEYEETEDQLKCIDEIKVDMESDKPMDRLLCGDVGYGKTEVAIRAVFKAVMDGKQVAYLVPTTVLAQQHYLTFRERMKDFPVTVDVISRFRSRGEQKRILADLKSGNIDVLIGTHRLLQKDIRFSDLGLLVVDEEQRFGVIHKERIKNLSPGIDVLTLTATPIPRTLHMSMVGIRDISTLEDPPENRVPVQTYVTEYRSGVIRDAIIREIARDGQVFYLSNRVRSIDVKAHQLQQLVPEACIAVAHGQMEEHQLEDVMLRFIGGEYDILVCTTIIESGLDMPNVNTIIVEDADTLGLAQLYQLRGRVGRSDRQGYAYITHKHDKSVSEIAEKRLKAIRDFTEFGSGFRIAMRDLEIRGAGNLLGSEQHGHIESVGYEMYCRLLEKAVKELRGIAPETADEPVETSIDLKVDAYISGSYIPSESQRIAMYKKISSIMDEADVIDIKDELTDRYGRIPPEVNTLVDIAMIKQLAASCGITSIVQRAGYITMKVDVHKGPDADAISGLSAKYRRKVMFNAGVNPYIGIRAEERDTGDITTYIKIILQDLKSFETH